METVKLRCNYCGRPCLENAIVSANPIEGAEPAWFVMCPQCVAQANTCVMCTQAHVCPFETDTSCPLPKQVQQTIRQGNMQMQTVVKNPDRIKNTCDEKNCPCFDKVNKICYKEYGVCKNYREIIPKGRE